MLSYTTAFTDYGFVAYRYRKCSRLPAWRPPMSPNSRGGKNGGGVQKRARSVEGLLESTVEPDPQVQVRSQMKKAKSLEEYLDTCDDDDQAENNSNASVSDSDGAKKRNFVNKCINKMKLFISATKKSPVSK